MLHKIRKQQQAKAPSQEEKMVISNQESEILTRTIIFIIVWYFLLPLALLIGLQFDLTMRIASLVACWQFYFCSLRNREQTKDKNPCLSCWNNNVVWRISSCSGAQRIRVLWLLENRKLDGHSQKRPSFPWNQQSLRGRSLHLGTLDKWIQQGNFLWKEKRFLRWSNRARPQLKCYYVMFGVHYRSNR